MVVRVEDLSECVLISKVHIYIYVVHQYVRSEQGRFGLRLKIRLISPVDQLDWSLPSSFNFD